MFVSQLALHLTISQTIFLLLASSIFQGNTKLGRLLTFFALSILGYSLYLLSGWDRSSIVGGIFISISYAIPGLVWLLAYAIFKSEERVPHHVWSVIALYMLLGAVGTFFFPLGIESSLNDGTAYILFYIVPQVINIAVYVHILLLVAAEYRQDLMEERRRLRVAFVALLGGFWLVVSLQVTVSVVYQLGFEVLAPIVELLGTVRYLLLFPVMCAINLLLFRIYKIDFPSENYLVKKVNAACNSNLLDPKELELKSKLLDTMESRKIYRQPGLSIGELAKELGVQEYRLRNLINKALEFTNFSHFLGHYRILDAERRLRETNDSIFNIGLDVGYTSLSSFHKAFKESYGVTPKEYRLLHRERRQSDILAHQSTTM